MNIYNASDLTEDKDNNTEKPSVKKNQCVRCGERIIPLSPKLIEKVYGEDGDVRGLSKMCPKCRRKVLWEGVVFKP